MKKILSIMLIAAASIMLSSCIINLRAENVEDPTYTFYFYNDTSRQYVYDWYLKDRDGENHAVYEDEYCEVDSGEYDKIRNLPEDDYQVWFCVYSSRKTEVYLHTDTFVHLDQDTTFKLTDEHYYSGKPRSAVSTEEDSGETGLVLIDSEGNVYPLKSGN